MLPRRRINEPKFYIQDEYKQKLNEGVKHYLQSRGLALNDIHLPRTGSRFISNNSIRLYEMHYRGLGAFAAMIGDYETFVVLMNDAPTEYCPSMQPLTLANYLR